jgi:hypothetical protein
MYVVPRRPRLAQTISGITRRDIFDFITLEQIDWSGRLEETAFLERIWDLHDMRSTDSRFANAAGDIWEHRVNNAYDWEDDWVFTGERFDLMHSPDDLPPLCERDGPSRGSVQSRRGSAARLALQRGAGRRWLVAGGDQADVRASHLRGTPHDWRQDARDGSAASEVSAAARSAGLPRPLASHRRRPRERSCRRDRVVEGWSSRLQDHPRRPRRRVRTQPRSGRPVQRVGKGSAPQRRVGFR